MSVCVVMLEKVLKMGPHMDVSTCGSHCARNISLYKIQLKQMEVCDKTGCASIKIFQLKIIQTVNN